MKTIKLEICAIKESISTIFTKNTNWYTIINWFDMNNELVPIELFFEHQWLDKSQHVLIERTHKWRFSNHKSSPIDKFFVSKTHYIPVYLVTCKLRPVKSFEGQKWTLVIKLLRFSNFWSVARDLYLNITPICPWKKPCWTWFQTEMFWKVVQPRDWLNDKRCYHNLSTRLDISPKWVSMIIQK